LIDGATEGALAALLGFPFDVLALLEVLALATKLTAVTCRIWERIAIPASYADRPLPHSQIVIVHDVNLRLGVAA
jgi:hypothetical protein